MRGAQIFSTTQKGKLFLIRISWVKYSDFADNKRENFKIMEFKFK